MFQHSPTCFGSCINTVGKRKENKQLGIFGRLRKKLKFLSSGARFQKGGSSSTHSLPTYCRTADSATTKFMETTNRRTTRGSISLVSGGDYHCTAREEIQSNTQGLNLPLPRICLCGMVSTNKYYYHHRQAANSMQKKKKKKKKK
jgi:hypothetical protein